MRALHLVLGSALILAGCDTSPRLDTSSDEAMLASIEKMKAELTEPQRQELTPAIAALVAPRMAQRSTQPSAYEGDSPQVSQAELLREFDGFTAEQLLARSRQAAR